MTPGIPRDERRPYVPTLSHKTGRTPQHCFHVRGVAPGLTGSQVATEAGPSPGVLALSGRQLGWAAVAAPPGRVRTR